MVLCRECVMRLVSCIVMGGVCHSRVWVLGWMGAGYVLRSVSKTVPGVVSGVCVVWLGHV